MRTKPYKDEGIEIKLRSCSQNDCDDLLSWRNDRQVQNACFNPGPISLEEHKKWFSSKLKNAGTKIYMAYDGISGKKVGVVRFELGDKDSEININLNPEFISKGLGVDIIKAATKKYINEAGNMSIIAKIKEDNIRSQKAFKKSGYVFLEDIMEKNDKAKLFIYEKNKK